ncbi:hypothetical protein Cgig2_014162 [Carnegiea gigantea]|uniref:Reverse transcriptase zinc-binding domain-containing protein n=1 Tax=Carnegiea gigantea TaxID=171969 RepID=A0A9Q1Q569_9CARY|nr:hypothetical protein Cgig2_014162 [Carnegiea gigantea]
MQCAICGAVEESDSHILIHCPMAMEIWNHSGFDRDLWDNNFPSIMDCILFAKKRLDLDHLGDFVAVLWECWNKRNRFIFGDRIYTFHGLADRAKNLVRSYRKVREGTGEGVSSTPQFWKPPEGMDSQELNLKKHAAVVLLSKRECNSVAHAIAHFQPFLYQE